MTGIQDLAAETTGRWLIGTESGTRLIVDLDDRWVMRLPASRGNAMPTPFGFDFAFTPLLMVMNAEVGRQGEFVLNVKPMGTGGQPYLTTTIQWIVRLKQEEM